MIVNGIKIEFTPAHAMNYKYIVCRKYEELFFYYGAFDDEIKAKVLSLYKRYKGN